MYYVYGKQNCPNCVTTKALLEQHNAPYEYIDIAEDNEARERLMSAGFRSVPQVYVARDTTGPMVHVGGLEEVRKALSRV
jgi:glutaredoxin-like protein NrdH